jgi:hypothetical protein
MLNHLDVGALTLISCCQQTILKLKTQLTKPRVLMFVGVFRHATYSVCLIWRWRTEDKETKVERGSILLQRLYIANMVVVS